MKHNPMYRGRRQEIGDKCEEQDRKLPYVRREEQDMTKLYDKLYAWSEKHDMTKPMLKVKNRM